MAKYCKIHEKLKISEQMNQETFQKRFLITCFDCDFKKTVEGDNFQLNKALQEMSDKYEAVE